MTVRNTSALAAAFTLGLLLAACGGGGGETLPAQVPTDSLKKGEEGNGLVNVGGKLFSIPSPVQTAMLVKKLGMPYDQALLLGTDNLARFTTKERQALALGVYGADLAYATIHKDGQRSLKMLKAIEDLGISLDVKNGFDKQLLEGFRKNMGNEDSLLRLSGKAYRAVDQYLKNDRRDNVSAGILAGGWVESMYLIIGADGAKVDPRVAERIGEQRRSLGNLIDLLGGTGATPALVDSLKGLAKAYEGVTSSYTFAQPKLDAEHKTTYINSTTKVQVPAETLDLIARKVRALRASIIA